MLIHLQSYAVTYSGKAHTYIYIILLLGICLVVNSDTHTISYTLD